MSIALDTSILVAAVVANEAFHSACRPLVAGRGAVVYQHALTETFNVLTGGKRGFRIPASLAADLIKEDLAARCNAIGLTTKEMIAAFSESESRGVRGGAVFDYLHLCAARKAGARGIYTLNTTNFESFRRSDDPEILHPNRA
jgi:predicted nucleic acid-binding protein